MALPLNYHPLYQAPFDDTSELPKVTRDVKALYVESYVPIVKGFDVTLSGPAPAEVTA